MPVLTLKAPMSRIPKIPGAGSHIKNAMQQQGLTQAEVARRSRMTKRRLDQLTRDSRDLTIKDAHALAQALGVNALGLIMAQQLRTTQRQFFSQMNRELNRSFRHA